MIDRIEGNRANPFKKLNLSQDTQILAATARLGARPLLLYHRASPELLNVRYKSDKTPVTMADERAETIMTQFANTYLPGIRI